MSRSRRIVKRALTNPVVGRVAEKVTRRQIAAYERRLPLLWNLYAHIPEATRTHGGGQRDRQRTLAGYYSFLSAHVRTLPYQPRISVLVPVFRPDPEYLRQALQSVVIQTYENWELCVSDDHSQTPAITEVLDEFAHRLGKRIRVTALPSNRGIAAASNAALRLATGEYAALLDHDDRLYPNALGEVVRHINRVIHSGKPQPEFLYSDERVIGEHGELLYDPFMKPDWSPFMHLSVNYTTHLSVYSTELLRRIGGFREGFDGSQDHDLALRVSESVRTPVEHIPLVLYQWRAHQASTAHSLDAKPEAAHAGVRAVSEACRRRGHPADVDFDPRTGHYQLRFHLPKPPPLVSIVIPTRNEVRLLRRCVESIRSKTTYGNVEILLVDNGSDEPEACQLLDALARVDNVRVIRDEHYFNFARLCNDGVREAAGDFVVLLNNDTEVLTPDWLSSMVGLAQWPQVGAVGAKLLYEDRHVQHAGIVGLGDVVAGHAGRGRTSDDPMYAHLINTVHDALGVTGACLMVARDKYWEVGGLDEQWVPNAYGDVDLCLRLRGAGYSNVYTPGAVLLHVESPSRKANIETFERVHMRHSWGSELLTDPFLNPNLLRSEAFTIDHRFLLPEVPGSVFSAFLAPDLRVKWVPAGPPAEGGAQSV